MRSNIANRVLLIAFFVNTMLHASEPSCRYASGSEHGMCGAPKRLAVVTGANRGIGIDVVSGLLSRLPADFDVLLTGRHADAVVRAVICLKERHYAEGSGNTCCEGTNAGKQPCEYGSWYYREEGTGPRSGPGGHDRLQSFTLDLTDIASISEFGAHVRKKYGRVDVLVNNGAAPSRAGPEQHVSIDHFGHLALHKELLPMLQPSARIVHVGSAMGNLRQFSPELREMLMDASLTQETLDRMLREYLELAQQGHHVEAGWPGGSGYAVAKMANAVTARIQARDLRLRDLGDDVLVNACCPGPANAPHTQKGAHVIIYLATLPSGDGRTGRWFVHDGWKEQPLEAML